MRSYLLQYWFKRSILNIFTLMFCITFISSFLISLYFQTREKEFNNIKLTKVSVESEKISRLDSYFLQAHLSLSDQQRKELQLLYLNYTNNLHYNFDCKQWQWLNLIEQIYSLLTVDQKKVFEKITKNIIFFK